MFVLRLRPVTAPAGLTDEIKACETRAELVAFYNEQRVPPYYADRGGRKQMRHHREDGPLAEYLPISVDNVDSDGAGIVEDTTRTPLTVDELAQLEDSVRSHGTNHPTIVHRLIATIHAGGPVKGKSVA